MTSWEFAEKSLSAEQRGLDERPRDVAMCRCYEVAHLVTSRGRSALTHFLLEQQTLAVQTRTWVAREACSHGLFGSDLASAKRSRSTVQHVAMAPGEGMADSPEAQYRAAEAHRISPFDEADRD